MRERDALGNSIMQFYDLKKVKKNSLTFVKMQKGIFKTFLLTFNLNLSFHNFKARHASFSQHEYGHAFLVSEGLVFFLLFFAFKFETFWCLFIPVIYTVYAKKIIMKNKWKGT